MNESIYVNWNGHTFLLKEDLDYLYLTKEGGEKPIELVFSKSLPQTKQLFLQMQMMFKNTLKTHIK